jgi:predicted RNase H-like HicB family nuclease
VQLSYTCWKTKEGGYVGFINQYPDYWTQGDTVKELEEMLASLYSDIMSFDDIQAAS